ncbi:MAG: shikimate kinase, partial [Dehalococcoidia bacterium]
MGRGENIVLTGFSGTGKSQVGRQVALMLGWRFVDTDEEIVGQAGKPVHRIFREEGEATFRTLESQVLREVLAGERQVVSTGGGAIVDPANLRLVLRRGLLVCLEARPETICQRLQENTGDAESDVRPLLAGSNSLKRIRTLKAARQPFYARARWTIHTDDLTIEEVARETVRAWQLLQGRGQRSDPDLAAVVHHSAGSYPV